MGLSSSAMAVCVYKPVGAGKTWMTLTDKGRKGALRWRLITADDPGACKVKSARWPTAGISCNEKVDAMNLFHGRGRGIAHKAILAPGLDRLHFVSRGARHGQFLEGRHDVWNHDGLVCLSWRECRCRMIRSGPTRATSVREESSLLTRFVWQNLQSFSGSSNGWP